MMKQCLAATLFEVECAIFDLKTVRFELDDIFRSEEILSAKYQVDARELLSRLSLDINMVRLQLGSMWLTQNTRSEQIHRNLRKASAAVCRAI